MEEIRIRPAGPQDIAHIVHHRRAMFADIGCEDTDALDAMQGTAERFLPAALAGGQYRGWLAETADGRVTAGAGIAIAAWPGSPGDPTPRRGWILNVYTEPEFRRRGIARRLMETVVAWCRDEGFRSVSLHASPFGRGLYEQMGFQPTNEMRLRLK
jgi:GNAT superfamily N-acetyltransferase